MKKILLYFRNLCVSSFPFVCFFLILSNVIVSCSVSRSCHPRYLYHTYVFTNEVITVVTQKLTHTSSSSPSPSSSSPSPSHSLPPVYPVQYEYFTLSGLPAIRLFGHVYKEGDRTSRGVILSIFPDRVYLLNGSVLENIASNVSETPRLPRKEFLKNDR